MGLFSLMDWFSKYYELLCLDTSDLKQIICQEQESMLIPKMARDKP